MLAFFHHGEETPRWKVDGVTRTERLKYIYSWWDYTVGGTMQLVGHCQGSSTIFRLPRDPRRPEQTQCSLHLSSSGPFTLSLNQTRGGGVVRFPGFGKNSWDISLIFYIQHYPCWAICPWFRVNPLLWFNTSGQPFLIRIMQFRSKSC